MQKVCKLMNLLRINRGHAPVCHWNGAPHAHKKSYRPFDVAHSRSIRFLLTVAIALTHTQFTDLVLGCLNCTGREDRKTPK